MARYHEIAADLAAKILNGQYEPGAALPPQRELSATYRVTLMTLRQALRMLSDDGLVVQQPGKGTYVAPATMAYQLDTLRSLEEDLRDQGSEVRTEVLTQLVRRPPAAVAATLNLPVGRSALLLERVRHVGGRPGVHQVSWVVPTGLRETDFTKHSLYAALAGTGMVVARAAERIRPEALPGIVARILGEPQGTPVFVSDRTTYLLDGTPVVTDRATILGRVMEIRTERAAAGVSIRWQPPA
ncbi:GntR family transcriptional regulator [Virgisporangium aliadipatigenens]|nr:GntR family transcriptional regulator [Virgisporangium aliadipatigenens]